MKEQYSLHVEFMVTGPFPTDGWYNIYHATINGNKKVYGSRTPGIWIFHENGKMDPSVHSAVDGNRDYATSIDPIQLNKWVIINVSQTKIENDFQYVVEVNGKVMRTVMNTNPRQFENVKIYISDPWYPAFPGYVRNVYLKGKVQLNTFDTLCVFLFLICYVKLAVPDNVNIFVFLSIDTTYKLC